MSMPDLHDKQRKRSGKERLLQASQELLKERPFDEITIDEIITAAELSRPAFYYHFVNGKEALRAELIERGWLADTPGRDIQTSILEAAIRVFARSGVPAATLDDIAREAGVTKGTLCWHYHTKDDLIESLVKYCGPHSILRPAIDQIEQELENGTLMDDETILRRIAGAFYDAFTAQGDLTRLAILLIYTHPDAAHSLAEKITRGRKRITEYVQQRQKQGYFRKEIDPTFFVHILAMTFLVRSIGREFTNYLPLGQLSREEVINQLVSLLLFGIKEQEHTH